MEGRLVNVRKLVAWDISLHGSKFILAEFGIGTPAILIIGTCFILIGQLLIGSYLVLIGVNYLPLLFYAIVRTRRGNKILEDFKQNKNLVRKYTTQQALILVPFAIVLLAITQHADAATELG